MRRLQMIRVKFRVIRHTHICIASCFVPSTLAFAF